jgi:hypothetical protein
LVQADYRGVCGDFLYSGGAQLKFNSSKIQQETKPSLLNFNWENFEATVPMGFSASKFSVQFVCKTYVHAAGFARF